MQRRNENQRKFTPNDHNFYVMQLDTGILHCSIRYSHTIILSTSSYTLFHSTSLSYPSSHPRSRYLSPPQASTLSHILTLSHPLTLPRPLTPCLALTPFHSVCLTRYPSLSHTLLHPYRLLHTLSLSHTFTLSPSLTHPPTLTAVTPPHAPSPSPTQPPSPSGFYVDGKHKGNESRFINHSCDPNCELQPWVVKGKVRIGIFAIKDIAENEPLSYDYQFDTNEVTPPCITSPFVLYLPFYYIPHLNVHCCQITLTLLPLLSLLSTHSSHAPLAHSMHVFFQTLAHSIHDRTMRSNATVVPTIAVAPWPRRKKPTKIVSVKPNEIASLCWVVKICRKRTHRNKKR